MKEGRVLNFKTNAIFVLEKRRGGDFKERLFVRENSYTSYEGWSYYGQREKPLRQEEQNGSYKIW